MSYIKLDGYFTNPVSGGVSVGCLTVAFTLDDESIVEFPVPVIPIGNCLAITPSVTVDGDALRVDLTRWSPVYTSATLVARFPHTFVGQAVAVQVARAFHADPNTSWASAPADMTTWLLGWGANNLITF